MVKVKKVNTKVAKKALGVVKTELNKVKKTAKLSTVKKTAKATTRKVKKHLSNEDKKAKQQNRVKQLVQDRGVVYIKHIPHGFYEKEMFEYFRQFGKVTALKVPRSKNGNAKGFAFIEFEYKEIAKVVADTMDNYLMFGRLLKTEYIPPEKQKPSLFHRSSFPWGDTTYKDAVDQRRELDKVNKNKTIDDTTFAAKINKKISKLQKNLLKKTGVQYKFQINETDDEKVQLLNVKPSTSEAAVTNNVKTPKKRSLSAVSNSVKKPKKRSLSAASVGSKKKLSKLDETDDKIKIKKSPNAVKKFIKTSKSKLKTVKSKTDVVKSKLKTEAKMNKKLKDLKSNVKQIKNKVQTKTKNVIKPKTKSVKTANKATSNKNKTKSNNTKFITKKIVKKGGTKKSK